ncbi:hypothetical protein NRB15_14965 [Pseudomonas alliivorans]|uniref:hypothetical protein n=1 Tax=Pseudomonas alliivorans TaxID=2810613 RepID=UPI00211C1CC9|nr:hypothetical protein [Pseudomonas alliivorans]MCQ9471640.1 hypothetical protein [Pseudomonas alliivorans]
MFRLFKATALALVLGIAAGCTQTASVVSEPLQPAPNAPVAYLVGSLGPKFVNLFPAQRQALLFRKRGSQNGAMGLWTSDFKQKTSDDIQDADGVASVFVLPLTPGDYEFYDFDLYTLVTSGQIAYSTSLSAKEKFTRSMHLEPGKAYYIGEFRSTCILQAGCAFLWRNEMARDGVIAKRQHPQMPALQFLPLDLTGTGPFFIDDTPGKGLAPKVADESRP